MTIFQAFLIPMPQLDEVEAIQWENEAQYLAVSENKQETTLVTQRQHDNCIGSS